MTKIELETTAGVWMPMDAYNKLVDERDSLQKENAELRKQLDTLQRSILRVLPTLVADDSCPTGVVDVLAAAVIPKPCTKQS